MRKRSLRTVRWVLFWAVLATSLLAVWRFTQQEPDLLSHATRLIARREDIGRYCWLSTNELLLLQGDSQAPHAVRFDTRTHKQTRLPGLEAALRTFYMGSALPSPDGQWLLCTPFDMDDEAHVVSLNGTRTLTWSVAGNTRLAWLPDSKRWVDMAFNRKYREAAFAGTPWYLKTLKIYDLRAPRSMQGWPMTQPASVGWDPLFLSGGSLLQHVTKVPAPPTPSGDDSEQSTALTVTAWTVTSERVVPSGLHTVHFPEPATVADAVVSPQGDRLAWMARREHPVPPLRRWLGRWFPRLTGKPEVTRTLYTASLDGSGIRAQGTVHQVQEEDAWHSLEWSPDGKRLSFQYAGALYTIPAE